MKAAVILAACVIAMLGGCGSGPEEASVPPESEIMRLEAALSGHPCVGDLEGWERNYRLSRKKGLLFSYSLHPDLEVIEFHLRRAGTIAITPGSKVMRWSENGDWPDSRTVEALDGRFQIEGGRLSIVGCKARANRPR